VQPRLPGLTGTEADPGYPERYGIIMENAIFTFPFFRDIKMMKHTCFLKKNGIFTLFSIYTLKRSK